MHFAETGRFPTEHSSYFTFLRAEHEEIMRLKWLESEKIGHDIGRDYAIWLWSMRHRERWIEGLRLSGAYPGLPPLPTS